MYSKEAVDASYTRLDKLVPNPDAMASDAAKVEGNITQNIVDLARQNPNIQFYVFYPPYSVYFWDEMNQRGVLNWQFDNLTYSTELMLECENIHLFSFYDRYDITCDLNNYKDFVHYSPQISELILETMHTGEHRLTKENYKQHFQEVRNYYSSYNYNALFE